MIGSVDWKGKGKGGMGDVEGRVGAWVGMVVVVKLYGVVSIRWCLSRAKWWKMLPMIM